MIGFAEGLLANAPRPVFTWSIDPTSGAITIISKTQPHKVQSLLCTAHHPTTPSLPACLRMIAVQQ